MSGWNKIKNEISNFVLTDPPRGIRNFFLSFIAGFLGMVAVYLSFRNNDQIFTDIVLDAMAFEDGNKAAEFYARGSFFVIYIISFIALNKWPVGSKHIKEQSERSLFGIIGICLFFLFWGIKTCGMDREKTSLVIIILGLVLYLYKRRVNGKMVLDILGGIYCIYLSLSGVMAFVHYVVPKWNDVIYRYSNVMIAFGVIIFGILYLHMVIYKSAWCSKGNFAIQALIPLNLISIIGVDYWYRGEKIVVADYKKFILLILGLCILLVVWGAIQYKKKAADYKGVFLTLPNILSYGIIGLWNTGYNLIINQDPYHVGETASVWNQVFEMGQKWGDEFVSVLQGMGLLKSAVNEWVFEGNIATYVQTGYILEAMACIIIVAALYQLIENKAILLFVTPLLPFFAMDRMYLIAWVYFFLLNPAYIKKPVKWTYCYILTCVVHVFYQPTYGGAVAFSLLPIFIYIWYMEHKKNAVFEFTVKHNRRIMIPFIASCILIAIMCIPMLKSALQFLSNNGYETQNANGTLFEKFYNYGMITLTGSESIDVALFLFARLGTGLLAFGLLVYFFSAYVIKDCDDIRKIQGLILTVSAGISYIMIMPAVLTRIDGGLSRIGVSSCIYFCGFISMLLYLYRSEIRFKNLSLLLLGVIGCVCIYIKTPEYFTIHKKAVEKVEISEEVLHINSSYSGLSNWGDVFLTDENYLHEAMILNEVCNSLLGEEQTYFDATDRQINYFYTNRRVPGVYASPYNMYNNILQEQTLKKLENEDYPIIFAHNVIPYASLRSYRVYRDYMLQDYNFVVYKDVSFMIRDDIDITPIEKDISYIEHCEDTVQSINNVFHIPNLQYLASEWGMSWENMKERFERVYQVHTDKQKYVVENTEYGIEFKINESISGKSAEFLRISLEYSDYEEKNAHVIVRGKDRNNQSFEERLQFISKEGDKRNQSLLLIPIGSSPQCLKANMISGIDLVFEPSDAPYEVSVDEMELYSLVD